MNAALYLRISLDRTGEHLGVDRQQQDCEALAKQLGWDVAPEHIYVDNDKSATSGKKRPAYETMLAAIDAGEVQAIVAWHADRLYRQVRDLGDLIDVCKSNNAQIATVKAGTIDLTTPTGRLVAGLLAQVATYEGEAKADRWKRSILQKREAGVPPSWGPRMYGYHMDGKVVDYEAALIRDMAHRLADGMSIRSLANRLNEAGERTSLGNPWSANGIRKLLTNRRLVGESTLKGETVGVGQWEPILDAETFEQVRAILTARTGTARRPRVAVLLGLIHCGKCDTRMVTGGRGGRGDQPSQRVYRCPTVAGGITGCGGVSILAEPVEELVEAYARVRLDDPRTRARIAALRGQATETVHEINALSERVAELEAQLDEPGVPVATILRARDRAKTRLEELAGKLADTTPTTMPTSSVAWPTDLGRRHALVRLVVARVTIHPTTWRGGGRVFDPERVEIEGR